MESLKREIYYIYSGSYFKEMSNSSQTFVSNLHWEGPLLQSCCCWFFTQINSVLWCCYKYFCISGLEKKKDVTDGICLKEIGLEWNQPTDRSNWGNDYNTRSRTYMYINIFDILKCCVLYRSLIISARD